MLTMAREGTVMWALSADDSDSVARIEALSERRQPSRVRDDCSHGGVPVSTFRAPMLFPVPGPPGRLRQPRRSRRSTLAFDFVMGVRCRCDNAHHASL